MKSRTRRWRGFAALTGPGGALIWGSLRPTEGAARTFFEQHNPLRPAVIVPVEIRLPAEASPPDKPADPEAG